PRSPDARPWRPPSATPACDLTHSGRGDPRTLSRASWRHVWPGPGHVLLSTPLRPGIPPGPVRRRAHQLGDHPPRGSDGLHRRLRRPLPPWLGPGGGQFFAQPPAVPPTPWLLHPGTGRGRPPYSKLADG